MLMYTMYLYYNVWITIILTLLGVTCNLQAKYYIFNMSS